MNDNGFSSACPSGNSMLEYSEETEYCEYCCGSGTIDIYNKKDLITYFDKQNLKVGEMLRIYHLWKVTSEVPCLDCEGQGEWIIYK